MSDDVFFDTNILLYLLTDDPVKASRSDELVAMGGVISVQVLNEFTSIATRKFKLPWAVVRESLVALRGNLRIIPVTIEVHDRGLALAEAHRFALYDAMIVAAAITADCKLLYSEDMQHGRVIEGLTIRNPYSGA